MGLRPSPEGIKARTGWRMDDTPPSPQDGFKAEANAMMINTYELRGSLGNDHADSESHSSSRFEKTVERHVVIARGLRSNEEKTIAELLQRKGQGSLMDDIKNARELDEVEQEQFKREHIRLRGR
jgi:hypothetical protein